MITGSVLGFGAATFGAMTGLSYYLYCARASTVQVVKDAPYLNLDSQLVEIVRTSPNGRIPYACIEGRVGAAPGHSALTSSNVEGMKAVIHSQVLKEVKTEWSPTSRLWVDTSRIIRNVMRSVPFNMTNESEVRVKVEEPLLSTGVKMEVVYDTFEPLNASFGESVVNWATGEKTKGFHTTEEMLVLGRGLVGYGELRYQDGGLTLGPPDSPGGGSGGTAQYILSLLSRSEIIRELESKTKLWKYLGMFFGSITFAILAWAAWRLLKRYRQQQEMRAFVRSLDDDPDPESESQLCLICVTGRRDVVLLECGHVCVCSACAQMLSPPHCPVCRKRITRTLPLFNS